MQLEIYGSPLTPGFALLDVMPGVHVRSLSPWSIMQFYHKMIKNSKLLQMPGPQKLCSYFLKIGSRTDT